MPSLICPECGHDARREQRLYKTRRRRKWIGLACALLVAAWLTGLQPKVQRDGWGSLLPSTALVLLFEFDDNEWVVNMLSERMKPIWIEGPDRARDILWAWQWRMLGRTVLERIEGEERATHRWYHEWLALSRDYGNVDNDMRSEINAALQHDAVMKDSSWRTSALISAVDQADLEGSLQFILQFLDDDDVEVQRAAASALATIAEADPAYMRHLLSALEHDEPTVRAKAAAELGSLLLEHGPMPSVRASLASAMNDSDCDVRRLSVHALAASEPPQSAWTTIEAAMQSPDPCIREGGFFAAWQRNDNPPHAVLSLLISALSDRSVQETAVPTLGRIDPSLLQPHRAELIQHAAQLQALSTHGNSHVREGALALRAIAERTESE